MYLCQHYLQLRFMRFVDVIDFTQINIVSSKLNVLVEVKVIMSSLEIDKMTTFEKMDTQYGEVEYSMISQNGKPNVLFS